MAELDKWEAETAAVANEYLKQSQRRLPASVRGETVVLRGPAELMLERFVTENGVDLVVMTSHARGSLPRFVLGSTGEHLVRAGVPTLLVHPTELAKLHDQAQRGADVAS